MLMANATEDSGLFLGDLNPVDDEEENDFSITMENLFKILEEKQESSQTCSTKDFLDNFAISVESNTGNNFHFRAADSTAAPESMGDAGLSQWGSSDYLETAHGDMQAEFGQLAGHTGSSNSLSGIYPSLAIRNGIVPSSQHADTSFCSFPNGHSPGLLTGPVQNQYQVRLDPTHSGISGMSMSDLQKANLHCFESSIKQEKGNEQMGAGSSPIRLMAKAGFGDGMPSIPSEASIPNSVVQGGGLGILHSMYPSMDSDANCPGTSTVVVKASEDNCRSRYLLPVQSFQPFVAHEEDGMSHMNVDRDDQQLPPGSEHVDGDVKFAVDIDKILQEVYCSDVDGSLPDTLCSQYSSCQDMSFKSESSTDSSPLTSSSNLTSHSINEYTVQSLQRSKLVASESDTIMPSKKRTKVTEDDKNDHMLDSYFKQHNLPNIFRDRLQKNRFSSSFSPDDDDNDDDEVCILDTISARPPLAPAPSKSDSVPERSGFSDTYQPVLGGIRIKVDDERLTYRIALQDLSQPKSEASPPDGVLTVPLLRHQRIALSWMVQKETASLNCSGGILADDQGLGKTVSTIALILMERSPSSKTSVTLKQGGCEALNLDDDDDISEISVMKQPQNPTSSMMIRPIKMENHGLVAMGRPAAGTLVVCPTSVLRQWADELQNKVSRSANLSFLVYHGTNRTKDPNELAKYDVVLTTYSIVNMEVPKQPIQDKDDEDKSNPGASGVSTGTGISKKRKNSPNKKSKGDRLFLESVARPLGRVNWFRVILDEAQSIKNHKTQVARACWGLRAKRRWCLSGTPIQNAVDDLYSYFRFLRYDPYATYKSFCSTIKMPISRNPTTGYKKLQAVLRTIMLRRTKGTLLDGKPIINLPPKTITLKKVDFSLAERSFYSTLEAESQEQFKEYAAAGTVKQNYVNILLMLLRLRQACDHPLLVKEYDSNSNWRASMEMAKNIPRDQRADLLSRLEACLALCTICNDPPEDSVVTICGHVFCNQCISEHLSGDDNICPSAHCRLKLTNASLFSRGTLRCSLSSQLSDNLHGESCPEEVDQPKLHGDLLSSNSSKIRAALEILQSLPRCQGSAVTNVPEKFNCEPNDSLEIGHNNTSVRCTFEMSGKKQKSIELDQKFDAQATEKAIVFSQWTRMLDMLEVPLKKSSIQYRRLDGTMTVAAREKAVKDFNTLPEVTVMIMSLKAASLGLNMVAACHVLLLDLWWNPTTEDQAIDRAHRIGQTRPVTVSRLTVKDTVEDRILALQEKKREMVASAFGEDQSGGRQSRLTVDDLKYLFMV